MRYYLDTADPDSLPDELLIHSVASRNVADVGTTWNGWAVPVVTAAEFARYIAAWEVNDPNGTWKASGVSVNPDTGYLTYDDGEHDYPDVWPLVGYTLDKQEATYALDGWVWQEVTHN